MPETCLFCFYKSKKCLSSFFFLMYHCILLLHQSKYSANYNAQDHALNIVIYKNGSWHVLCLCAVIDLLPIPWIWSNTYKFSTMKVTHLRGPPSDGWTTNMCQRNPMNKVMKFFTPRCSIKTNNSMLMDKNGICAPSIMKHCHLANDHAKFYPSPIISCRKHISSAGKSRYCSDCSEPPYNEGFTQKKEHSLTSFRDNIL